MLITANQLLKHGEDKGRFFHKEESIARIAQVSFQVGEGECVGLVGESGSGKSTIARTLLGLETLDGGEIKIDGWPAHTWRKMNRGK